MGGRTGWVIRTAKKKRALSNSAQLGKMPAYGKITVVVGQLNDGVDGGGGVRHAGLPSVLSELWSGRSDDPLAPGGFRNAGLKLGTG